uniref:Uncharacterized protein n=1 Tax=Candidatus Kentrum sp. MB TaxID=2138164 RepID=A0A451BB08_9GAMM|nr:MAG: hypothetical protein BECKMB1821G_GA0114241_102525 [Candidatus Kentron sp. MB]VFK31417.1 MAG: hypothetical protein BECKMB1821I_GA0114274_102325 [Candidatus Kentron sp. MB]VFK75473.1 MAG: hypothetical protein BECKMB1821H_GA0114242_102325 [Candidatus Kentron sp. MB]
MSKILDKSSLAIRKLRRRRFSVAAISRACIYEEVLPPFKMKSEEVECQGKEIDQQIKRLGKQIGGFGGKFGLFQDDQVPLSMEPILIERFGMIAIALRLRIGKNGEKTARRWRSMCWPGSTTQSIRPSWWRSKAKSSGSPSNSYGNCIKTYSLYRIPSDTLGWDNNHAPD